jgi:hypothetical protein
VRAKEDCCSTCIRLSIAVADPSIGEEEKKMIEEFRQMHANDARTQRTSLKEAIEIWVKTADLVSTLSQRGAFIDAVDSLLETIEAAFLSVEDRGYNKLTKSQIAV